MFKIFTVGWDPEFIEQFLGALERDPDFEFFHGLIGDADRVDLARTKWPDKRFATVSKSKRQGLPRTDFLLLGELERKGLATIREMVQGDRVMRRRPSEESLQYATLLAVRMRESAEDFQPDLVLASHDGIHAAMSLAVAKSMNIPWVALAFTTIPGGLTAFSRGLTPNQLVPLERIVDEQTKEDARKIVERVRKKTQPIMAYRAPMTIAQWSKQYVWHAGNLLIRKRKSQFLGIDRFTYPTTTERAADIIRRSFNRLTMPASKMIQAPPKRPFVYFPLHMAPESSVDTWAQHFQDQISLAKQFSIAVPTDTDFVVKLHFSDPDNYSRGQVEDLVARPGVHVAHPSASGSKFIEEASFILGIQGTSCLEGALAGKPVLMFGDSPYLEFPSVKRAGRPDEWFEQVVSMRQLPRPNEDEILEAYTRYLARYMPGRINDWSQTITLEETQRIVSCFHRLKDYVRRPDIRENWYEFDPFGVKPMPKFIQ